MEKAQHLLRFPFPLDRHLDRQVHVNIPVLPLAARDDREDRFVADCSSLLNQLGTLAGIGIAVFPLAHMESVLFSTVQSDAHRNQLLLNHALIRRADLAGLPHLLDDRANLRMPLAQQLKSRRVIDMAVLIGEIATSCHVNDSFLY